MNEDKRLRKLDYSERLNDYNKCWYVNFLKGLTLFTVPALFVAMGARNSAFNVPRYF